MTTSETSPRDGQPTEHQQEILSAIQRRDLVDAFDKVLLDRGIPLRVRRVEFEELPISVVSDRIGPDPATLPPVPDPPPGGVYSCWFELDYGAWVCECLEPGATAGPH